MKCSNCGAEIEMDSKFCQYCGTALSKEDAWQNSSVALTVEMFFGITGRGLIVSGTAIKPIKIGDNLINKRTGMLFKVASIEISRRMVKEVKEGTACGLLFQTASASDFQKLDELVLQ